MPTISKEAQALIDAINNVRVNPYHSQVSSGGNLASYLTTSGAVNPLKNNAGLLKASDIVSGSGKKKVDGGINIFDMLSGILNQVGGAVTDNAYHQIADYKNLFHGKDVGKSLLDLAQSLNPSTTISRGVQNGAKEQWKDWTDKKLSWGDIPLVGFLHGADTGWKRGEDILKDQVGMKAGWGRTAAGIGIDLLADPLTYFTGGLSAAGKASKAAELAKLAEIAAKEGIAGKFSKFGDLRQVIALNHRGTQASLMNKLGKYSDELYTTVTKAHNDAINTLGMSIPFSNRYMKVHNLSENSLLFRGSPKIGEIGATKVMQDLRNRNLNPEEILQRTFGIKKAEDLTKAQLEDLTSKLESFDSVAHNLPKAEVNTTVKTVKNTPDVFKNGNMQEILNKFPYKNAVAKSHLQEILNQVMKDPSVEYKYGAKLSRLMSKYWRNLEHGNPTKKMNKQIAKAFRDVAKDLKDVKTKQVVETTANMLKDVSAKGHSRFVDNIFKPTEILNTESTNLAKKIAKHNPFDLRTFKSSNDFINAAAEHLANATNAKIGGIAQYRQRLQGLEKLSKELNPSEMKASIHMIENHFPKGFSWDGIDKAKAQNYAKEMGKLFKELGKNERDVGLMGSMIKHYFPHVRNLSDRDIEQMMKHIQKFNGKSMKNAFNQERTGFRTLAERDNFIADAEKELTNNTKLTDEERSSLEETIAKAKGMFNENTNEVILKRVGASVQAQAMKEMYTNFKKMGVLVTKTKGTKVAKGLERVPTEVADKLGLGKGVHFMHPDVMKGLEKVDELFTSGGMNRFMRLLNGTSSLFRTVTTVYLPSHYINNWLGNLAINMAAGVGIKDYTRATKLLNKYNRGEKLLAHEQKIIDAAFKHNVINGGYRIDTDISRSVTKAGDEGKLTTKISDKLEGLNEKLSNNKLGKAAKEKGELIDDYARLANFMNGLDKHNGSVKLASDQVRKYLFNYAENTNADKHMRAIVPFWNWVKRNVPLQLNQIIENPKYYKSTEAFKALFNEAFNPDDKGQDWQKQSGIKIPFEDKYMRLPFPTSDLDMLAHPSQALASTTPLIKAPIELLTNHNLFTGNPLQFGSNKVDDPKVVLDYLLRSTGIGGKMITPFYDSRNKDLSTAEKIRKALGSLFVNVTDAK